MSIIKKESEDVKCKKCSNVFKNLPKPKKK